MLAAPSKWQKHSRRLRGCLRPMCPLKNPRPRCHTTETRCPCNGLRLPSKRPVMRSPSRFMAKTGRAAAAAGANSAKSKPFLATDIAAPVYPALLASILDCCSYVRLRNVDELDESLSFCALRSAGAQYGQHFSATGG